MEQINQLLNKKMMLLENILQITKKASLTGNNEEDYETLVSLIDKREEMFNSIKEIDNSILKLDKNALLTNNTILSIKDNIIEVDIKLQEKLKSVKDYYLEKIKELKTGRKMTNHFSVNMFNDGGHFDSQG